EVVVRMMDRFGRMRVSGQPDGAALAASTLVMRLLAKRAADRPASAGEVARALAAMERTLTPQAAPGRWWLWAAVPLLGLLSALLGAWYFLSHLPTPQEERQGERGVSSKEASVPAAEVHLLEGHTAEIECVAFLPDGQRALSAGRDRVVRLWDLQTGKQLLHFPEQSGWIHALAVSADGRQALAAGGSKKDERPTRADCVVHLLDVESGREVKQFEGHTDAVNALAF